MVPEPTVHDLKVAGRSEIPFLQASDPNTYSTPYEFRDDMRLVWSNCRTYNPPHVPVRNMGEAMSDAWEKRWNMSGIEGKWEEEQHRQNLEEQVRLVASLLSNVEVFLWSASSISLESQARASNVEDQDQEQKKAIAWGLAV